MKKQITFMLIVFSLFIFTSCSANISENADMYTATSVEMLGVSMAPEDVSEGGITLLLDENGSAVLNMSGQSHNAKWEVSGTSFTLTQGADSFTGTMDGSTVKIINLLNLGLDITFVKDGESEAVAGSENEDVSSEDSENTDTSDSTFPGYDSEKTIAVETLSNPSNWYGVLTITDYVGENDYNGEYEIWAYLNTNDVGPYFEIYSNSPKGESDSAQFISFYIEQHDYTFFPIVDDGAWILSAPLKEEDNTWFTPTLINGVLSATYDYDYEGESFTFTYDIAQIEGSDSAVPEENLESSESEPESNQEESSQVESSQDTATDVKFTIDELREIFLSIEDADSAIKTALTYDEIKTIYFDGVDGEIQYDDPDFKSYLWRSSEDETAYVYISFEEDDSGVINYLSHSMSNITRDG